MIKTALYRHFASDGRLLYIGISMRPGTRLSEHLSGSDWADQISIVKLDWFPNFQTAFDAERRAIFQDRPEHNKTHQAQGGTAQRVLSLRVASNCTQADFAELIGVSRARLGNWETGVQRLSLTGAIAIRKAFGVSLDWLFPEDEAAE